jgi:predicted DCC family thiol-disulfide oxidoreductase YuxK
MGGWVLYDGDCRMCTALARRFSPVLTRYGYALTPLQDDWVRSKLAMPEDELLKEMRVLTPEGDIIGGADSIVYLASQIWWARPFALAAKIPGAMPVLRVGYRWIAENRGCRNDRCERPAPRGGLGWLPLLILVAGALQSRAALPTWLFMWTLSVAIYFGFKWWMFRAARSAGASFSLRRVLGFLFLWPGMDARSFSTDGAAGAPREWAAALFKTALGAMFFWGAARRLGEPLAAGWCGMIGLVLILHFGIFHLLSLAWRAVGVNAQPLMNSPLLAGSLGDFWGNRWNLAFRQIGYELVFVPFRKAIGASAATAAIFLSSGLIHDLVISLPARAGYGLPTLYFVLQGAGLLAEKTAIGRRLGLAQGWIGRAFTFTVAAGPAFWLFHPPFVLRVMIPFMKTVGAL